MIAFILKGHAIIYKKIKLLGWLVFLQFSDYMSSEEKLAGWESILFDQQADNNPNNFHVQIDVSSLHSNVTLIALVYHKISSFVQQFA